MRASVPLENTSKEIEEELDRLHFEAAQLANTFWTKHWNVQVEDPDNHGYLGVRVRRENGGGLTIGWFRAVYWKRHQSGERKGRPQLEHLSKGRGTTYTHHTFVRARAKQWEIDAAMALEKEFGEIRRQVAMLGKMRRYIAEYRRGHLPSDLPDDAREQNESFRKNLERREQRAADASDEMY